LFNGAAVENGHGEARLVFKTPAVLRLGVEMRPVAGLRVELAAVYEGWSIHDRIDILRAGKGTNLTGVTGFPSPYPIGDLSIVRNFRDTFSVRLGGEYTGGTKALGFKLRAGFVYDRSAIPPEYLSVLTLDVDKFTPTIGASLLIGKFSLDVVYAHVFGLNTTVDPTRARIYALSPVRGDPVERTAVNGGDYTLQANVIGLGATYRFD
jgi:long-chain fatty acid transport protein